MKRIILLIPLFFACCTSRLSQELDEIEGYLDVSRDSAYAILQDPKWQDIHSSSLQARYNLILSIVEDKLDLIPSSDSMIRAAHSYYSKHQENPRYTMLSTYYYGDYYEDHLEYSDAILMFQEAFRLATDLKDDFYCGMSLREIGLCYRVVCCPDDAIVNLDKSEGYFKRAGKTQHAEEVNLFLSELYAQKKDVDTAFKGLCRAIAYFTESGDIPHIHEAYTFLNAIKVGQYDMSASVLESYRFLDNQYGIVPDYYDYGILAVAYAKQKNKALCEECIERSMQLAESDNMQYWAHHWAFQAYKELGDVKSAFKSYEDMETKSVDIFLPILSQSIAISHRSHYYKSWQEAEYLSARYLKYIHLLSILCALLLLCLIILMFMYLRRGKELQDAKSSVKSKEQTISRLSDELGREAANRYLFIPPGSYLLDDVCELMLKDELDNIGEKVLSLINDLQYGSKAFRKIENDINKSSDNIIGLMRKELPNLKKDDIKLYAYVISKLSNAAICVLTGAKNPDSVSSRLFRLKKRIEEDNPPHKELFLSLLKG